MNAFKRTLLERQMIPHVQTEGEVLEGSVLLKIYITVRLWKDQGKWLYKAEHYLKAISIKGRHSIKYNCSTFCLTISHKTTASINVFEFLNCLELSNCKNSSICKKPMISKYKIKWMWDKPLLLPQTIVKWVRKWKDYWNF